MLAACADEPEVVAGNEAQAPARVAAAAPVTPDPSPALAPDSPVVRTLEIAGDFALTQAERAALYAARQREAAVDPAAPEREDAELRKLLARYDRADPVFRARLRHTVRAALHFGRDKEGETAALDILARRDPVLIEDSARKDVVSLADIAALDASNQFVAEMAGIAAPDSTEQPGERAILQARYRDSQPVRYALTQAGTRHAMTQAAFAKLPDAKRRMIADVVRANVRDSGAVSDAAREIENAAVDVERKRIAAARASTRRSERNSYVAGMHRVNVDVNVEMTRMRLMNDTITRYF